MADRSDRTPSGPRPPAPLVGRGTEMAALRAALAQVVGGTPSAVVLTGPTGIGKTRLAQEARALAADAGLRTLASRAYDLSREVPYAPVVAAFAPLLRDLEPAERGELVADLPQLGLVFSGLAPGQGTPATAAFPEPDLRRISLLDGLTRLLDRLSHRTPLLWALDDVHAADTETRRLLLHLAAALPDRPVLLLLTARDDEPAGDQVHDLARGFQESAWRTLRLRLDRLSDEDAVRLVTTTMKHPLSDELARTVVTRAVGRPLFLESLSQALIDGDRLEEREGRLALREPELPLPEGIHQHLRARLAPLAPEDRTVLEVTAVAGGPLDDDALATVAQLSRRRLGESLARLERRRCVVRSGPNGYDVTHGLLRDAILADLSRPTVESLHADLARVLSERDPQDPRAAEHVLRAGPLVDPDTAVTLLVGAAGRARQVGATADARRYLEAAVALLRGPHPPRAERRWALADLLTDLGELATQLADYPQGRAWFREALEEYRSAARPTGVARAHRALAMLEWIQGDLSAGQEQLDAAEAVLEGLEPGHELGQVLHTRMVAAGRVGDLDALEAVAARLQALADRIDSPGLAVRAHLAAATAAYSRTDYERMVRQNQRALEAATALDEPELLLRVHDQISVAAGCTGDLPTLRQHSLESLRIAREAGAPAWEPWPRVRVAYADLLAGDLDAGLRGTSEVLGYVDRFPQPRGEASLCAAHAIMLAHAGRLKEARGYMDRALEAARSPLRQDRNIFSAIAYAATVVALAEGRPEQAHRAAAPLAEVGGGWLPLLGAAAYGEACAAVGDAEGAERTADRLEAVISCTTELPLTLASWVRGLARAGTPAAGPLLSEARAGFGRLGLVVHEATVALAAAREQRDQDPDAAVQGALAALTTFDAVGMPQQALAARDLLRSWGVTPSRGRGRSTGGGPLSARELQVARLVAAGLTNAEVASELFISPRTVSTHLDRIYARLGLSSRAALTRYLADSGLLESAIT